MDDTLEVDDLFDRSLKSCTASSSEDIEDLLWLHPDEMASRNDLAPLLTERVLPALGW